ncbi:hypothetical protein KUTeg_016776 [Tegillarca granosa]|uniref:ABC-2 type transporter transmembrane domain-containing protein n=1 Tax=Tegillarca granosa TaxID=220873 RepID=A0ABQ9ELX3_TEGGR|nr:hypothetical protein KUTeg_016776 [Tegillarca granosa]
MIEGMNNLTYTLKTVGVKQLTGFLQDFDACPSIEQVDSAEDIKNLICLSGGLSQLFEIADHPALERLQHKLCNMRSSHLYKLYQDFKSEFSIKSVFFEIFKYIFINSGRLPNIANIFLKMQNIFQDMKYLNAFNTEEWKSLSQDLNTDNVMESLGLFVCGSNSFLKVDAEENNDFMSKFQTSKDKAVDDSDKDLTNDYGPDYMYRMVQLGEAWGEYVDDIFSYMDTDNNLDLLRAFSNSCICDLLEGGLQSTAVNNEKLATWLNGTNGGLCRNIRQLLNDDVTLDGTHWKHIFNYTRQFARIMANYGPVSLIFDVKDKHHLPSHITYKIRMDIDRVDTSKQVMDRLWTPGSRSKPGEDTKFLTYGFAYLQDIVDHAIIKLQTGVTDGLGIVLQQFPYPCYIQDNFMIGISMTLPLFLVLAWVWPVAMLSKNVVHEKEKRLKEIMKIMGLSNGVHWVAWFITSFIVMFLTVCLLVFVITAGRVVEHSDPFIVLLFMTVFAVSTIMQCIFFSSFFCQANIAACCAGFLYFVLYLPYVMVKGWEELMFSWHKFLVCTSSSVAFGFGCTYIARFEEQAVGIQWENIASSPMVDDHFNMFYCIVMMLVDTVIYAVLTWYIEAVFPGGMKRLLSVAMAFVGNAKTVILDEPTAGVDPYARRAIWDLLLKFKQSM